MNAKIEKLKQRAALWRQKADQHVASAEAKAEVQSNCLIAKAEELRAQTEARFHIRVNKWEDAEKIQKINEEGDRAVSEIYQRWTGRARALQVNILKAAELQAGLWRAKAAALEAEAVAEETRVQKIQQEAWAEETRNNR
jgi:hypothetical protein